MSLAKGLLARMLCFRGFVWTLCILVAIYVVGGPLAKEAWARWMWQRVPCYLVEKSTRYFFDWNNKHYLASRMNIWGTPNQNPHVVNDLPTTFVLNDICYVQIGRSNQVGESVYQFDGYKNWSKIGGRSGLGVMILVVAFMITRVTSRKSASSLKKVSRLSGSAASASTPSGGSTP